MMMYRMKRKKVISKNEQRINEKDVQYRVYFQVELFIYLKQSFYYKPFRLHMVVIYVTKY